MTFCADRSALALLVLQLPRSMSDATRRHGHPRGRRSRLAAEAEIVLQRFNAGPPAHQERHMPAGARAHALRRLRRARRSCWAKDVASRTVATFRKLLER
jgi:hypothetical protein